MMGDISSSVNVRSCEHMEAPLFLQYHGTVLLRTVSWRNNYARVGAVLPWFSNGASERCRPYLLKTNFARGGDIMIGSQGMGGTRLLLPLLRCRMVLRMRRQKVWWLASNSAFAGA